MKSNNKTPITFKKLNIYLTDIEVGMTEDEYKELVNGITLKKFMSFINSNKHQVRIMDTDTIGHILPNGIGFDEINIESI